MSLPSSYLVSEEGTASALRYVSTEVVEVMKARANSLESSATFLESRLSVRESELERLHCAVANKSMREADLEGQLEAMEKRATSLVAALDEARLELVKLERATKLRFDEQMAQQEILLAAAQREIETHKAALYKNSLTKGKVVRITDTRVLTAIVVLAAFIVPLAIWLVKALFASPSGPGPGPGYGGGGGRGGDVDASENPFQALEEMSRNAFPWRGTLF